MDVNQKIDTKMCGKEIGLRAHNLLTIMYITINIIREPYTSVYKLTEYFCW